MTTHPLDRLFETISARKGADPSSSYTAKLFSKGQLHCAKKMGEEAIETALAAVAQDRTALTNESADLLYHLMVLWAASGITPDEVFETLRARENQSGLEEKASRKS
jgi:phosphoribosyl-ATP pyrophosphohydrolase